MYAFDVFVHVDLHVQWRYFEQFAKLLKPGGRGFVSTANLLTTKGFERFSGQKEFHPIGFYFVTPDLVKRLIARAGLRVISEGRELETNVFLARDYLVVFEKPL